MQTDRVKVMGTDAGLAQALEECERFCAYARLSGKAAIHVRLLTEEALGMIRGILGNRSAQFWLETAKKGGKKLCRICISVDTDVNNDLRQELLSVSTSGRNAAAVGIVGKIRELIEIGLQGYDEASRLQSEGSLYGANYATMGMVDPDGLSNAFFWSLDAYKDQVSGMEQSQETEKAWDELEKSVVSRLADEVRVGIRQGLVELVVEKQI